MGHHNNVPDNYPMPEVNTEQTCFICPQNVMSAVCYCRSYSQDCVPRGWLSLKTEDLSASSGTDATDHHEVLWGPSFWMVPIIVWYHLHSHFHDCCYNIFTGWCLYSPWVTCIQVCCSCDLEMLLPSSKHISAYYDLYDVQLDDAVHIPVQQYQLNCYMHWGLGASCSILHVCLDTTTLLRSMLLHLTRGNVFVCSHSEEKDLLMDALHWRRTFCVKFLPNVSQ
jgi:hypothetical protein